MSYCEKISCRVAIQVCIGHFTDGRERHRTFSMKGVDPDASPEAIAVVVRALAPLLAYPITKVRKIVKRRIIIYEEGVVPWADQENRENAEPDTYTGLVAGVPSRNVLPFPPQPFLIEPPQGNPAFFRSGRSRLLWPRYG